MRQVKANDETGYWGVHEDGALLVSGIESESVARELATAPDFYDASLETTRVLDNLIHNLERIAGASMLTGLANLKRKHIAALNKTEGK